MMGTLKSETSALKQWWGRLFINCVGTLIQFMSWRSTWTPNKRRLELKGTDRTWNTGCYFSVHDGSSLFTSDLGISIERTRLDWSPGYPAPSLLTTSSPEMKSKIDRSSHAILFILSQPPPTHTSPTELLLTALFVMHNHCLTLA